MNLGAVFIPASLNIHLRVGAVGDAPPRDLIDYVSKKWFTDSGAAKADIPVMRSLISEGFTVSIVR